jgi:TRAP transporter TAXI family solute receptor
MKKQLCVILSVFLLMVTILAGCSSPEPDSPKGSEPAENNESVSLGGSYTMATAGTAGTFYPFGGALCQIVNEAIGTNITANATGGGKENIALLANEEVDIALLDADLMSYALTGTEMYEGNKIDTFGSIASLFPQVLQIVVAEDSDIYSVTDLKGKRVSVGDAGSGTAVNAKQLFEVYGMTFDDMKVSYISFKESAAAFQDKSLDAFIGVAGIPTSAVTETSLSRKIRLLSIDKEYMDMLMKKYPFFAPITVGKDVYSTENDGETVAVNATIAALKSVSEEVVYHFTKAMFEHQAELAEVHAKGKDLSIETALDGIDAAYLHPGAAKYYREIGILK